MSVYDKTSGSLRTDDKDDKPSAAASPIDPRVPAQAQTDLTSASPTL